MSRLNKSYDVGYKGHQVLDGKGIPSIGHPDRDRIYELVYEIENAFNKNDHEKHTCLHEKLSKHVESLSA